MDRPTAMETAASASTPVQEHVLPGTSTGPLYINSLPQRGLGLASALWWPWPALPGREKGSACWHEFRPGRPSKLALKGVGLGGSAALYGEQERQALTGFHSSSPKVRCTRHSLVARYCRIPRQTPSLKPGSDWFG